MSNVQQQQLRLSNQIQFDFQQHQLQIANQATQQSYSRSYHSQEPSGATAQPNPFAAAAIQFDLGTVEEPLKSWCTSDNSSCCSLCRLNDNDGEETMFGDLGSEALNDLVLSAGLLTRQESVSQTMEASPSFSAASTAASTAASANDVFAARPQHPPKCSCSSLFKTCGACTPGFTSGPMNINPSNVASKVFNQGYNGSPILSAEQRSSLHSLLLSVPSHHQPDLLTAGFLPEDPIYSILSFLDVPMLVEVRLVSKKMKWMASDDNAGWRGHCVRLWEDKVRVCEGARRLLEEANAPDAISPTSSIASSPSSASSGSGSAPSPTTVRGAASSRTSAMEAYKTSILEAERVNELSEEDLCFDLEADRTGVQWSFRFKESAGLDWTSWDPWWKNGPARKLVFLRSGTILQSHPPGRTPPITTHNSTPLYDVFSERLVQQNGNEIIPPRIEMKWRFVEASMDLPRRPDGAYVRITVGGRDVPTYVVRRSPNGNWGFIMESCWGLYASFQLAPQHQPQEESGRRALRRTRNGTRWVHVDGENETTEEDNTRNVRRRLDPSLGVEESAMTVTGVSQWREALLYNIGAVTLPEGNNALNQFDTAWQNALLLR